MTNREILDKYFEYANAGKWDAYCDLYSEDCEMDEQLAGHLSGLKTLRDAMSGFPNVYKSFSNVPKTIFISGDEGAAVTHISARAMKYPDEPIEADTMNYFRFKDGKIVYMANFHDGRPFAPFLRQFS